MFYTRGVIGADRCTCCIASKCHWEARYKSTGNVNGAEVAG